MADIVIWRNTKDKSEHKPDNLLNGAEHITVREDYFKV
jgi:hypothetical protein